MNWEQLADKITDSYDSGRNTLDVRQSDFATVPAFSKLFDDMNMRNVLLVNVTSFKPDGTSITVRGRIRQVPGLAKKEVSAAAIFSLVDGEMRMVFAFGVPAPDGDRRWTFKDSFPQLENTALSAIEAAKSPAPLFIYSSVKHDDRLIAGADHLVPLNPGLNFHGGIAFKGKIFDTLGSVAGTYKDITVTGPITISDYGPNFIFALDEQAGFNGLLDLIKLPHPHSSVTMESEFFADGTHSVGLRFGTTFNIGGDYALKLEPMLVDDSGAVTLKATFDNLAFPGLDRLARGFGTELGGLDALLPPPLTGGFLRSVEFSVGPGKRVSSLGLTLRSAAGDGEVPLVPKLKLKSVDRKLAIKDPFDGAKRKVDMTAGGTIGIGSLQLEASASYPKQMVKGGLRDGTTFDPTSLIGAFFPGFADVLPPFNKLRLQADLKAEPHHYWITAEGTDSKSWSVVGVSPVRLTGLKLGLTNGRKVNGQIKMPVEQVEGQTSQKAEAEPERDSSGWPKDVKPGELAGVIAGSLELFGRRIDAVYDAGQAFRINAQLPNVDLDLKDVVTRLLGDLGTLGISVPLMFPDWLPSFRLKDSAICIAHNDNDAASVTLALRTTVNDGPLLAFEALKTAGNWGFVAGVEIGGLSSLPGLSALAGFIALEDVMVIISSATVNSYEFPGATRFENPALDAPVPEKLKKAIKLPDQTNGKLIPGVSVCGRWVLDGNDTVRDFFIRLLGLHTGPGGRIAFNSTLQIGSDPLKNSKVFASFPIRIAGMPVAGGQLGLMLVNEMPAFFASGHMTVSIQSQDVVFDVTLMVVPNGALVYGAMIGTVSIPFIGLTLTNLVIVLGVSFELAPTFGFACQLDTSAFHSSLAFLENSTDPGASVLAGSVSDLSLKDVVTTIAHTSVPPALRDVLDDVKLSHTLEFTIDAVRADDLDHRRMKPVADAFAANADFVATKAPLPEDISDVQLIIIKQGETWAITDMKSGHKMRRYQLDMTGGKIRVRLNAQLYCVPKDADIGPLHFDQGFRLNGKVKAFAVEGEVNIEVSPPIGITADGTLKPIVLDQGGVRLFGITSSSDSGKGPRFSIATFERPGFRDLVHPDWSEYAKAHFLLDGKITLLEISSTTKITVDNDGLAFKLKEEIGPLAKLDLGGTFKPKLKPTDTVLEASGSIDFDLGHVSTPVGSFNLASFSTGITIGYHGSLDAKLHRVEFGFLGETLGFDPPGIKIDDRLADLPGKVKDMVIDKIVDYLNPLHQLEKLGKELAGALEDFGKSIGELFEKSKTVSLHDEFAEAAKRGIPAVAAVKVVTTKLVDIDKDRANYPDHLYRETMLDAIQAIMAAYKMPDTGAAMVLKAAGVGPAGLVATLILTRQIEGALHGKGLDALDPMAPMFKGMGYSIADVKQGMLELAKTEGANFVYPVTLIRLRQFGYTATEFLRSEGSRSRDNVLAQDMAIFRLAGYSAEEVGQALKNFGAASDLVAKALHDSYGSSDPEMARILRHAGYPLREIVSALRSAYNTNPTAMAALLVSAGVLTGYSVEELADGFVDLPGETYKLYKPAGCEMRDVARVAVVRFQLRFSDLSTLFQRGGYDSAAIAAWRASPDTPRSLVRALKSAGSTPADALAFLTDMGLSDPTSTAEVLASAGYAAEQVGRALNKDPGETARLLRIAAYTAADAAVVLHAMFSLNGTEIIRRLKQGGYRSIKPEARLPLVNTLKAADATATDVVSCLVGFAAADDSAALAQDLKTAGYGAADIGTAFYVGPRLAAQHVVELLKGLGTGTDDVRSWLLGIGWDAGRLDIVPVHSGDHGPRPPVDRRERGRGRHEHHETEPTLPPTLTYGRRISIMTPPPEATDHRCVAAFQQNVPEDLATEARRYVVFDAEHSDCQWAILDPNGESKRNGSDGGAPFNFGDTITLGVGVMVSGSQQTYYLSCRDDSRLAAPLGRRVAIAPHPQAWEQWTIIDPTNPASTRQVSVNDTFALKSAFGDYLSQRTDSPYGVLRTAPSMSAAQYWMAT